MMRTGGIQFLAPLMMALAVSPDPSRGSELDVAIRHTFAGQELQLNSLRYINAAGESFSITRLSYLLSGFSVEKMDGSWLEISDPFAWMDAEKERTSANFVVPAGEYRGLRFYVGLDTNANHGNPARFAANHPLDPNL